LYISIYGEPQMIDNSDLSVTDFKDENGNYYAASQRSQMILVASKPSAEQEKEMDGVLKENMGVKDEDIVSSATYEINLHICGQIPLIPNGTYMQLSFGFPEGYRPEDTGTTYKIYHYKRGANNEIVGVEEIPVIVNEYGIIAKVSSFSPFTVVQLKNSSAAVTNSDKVNVYAYVNGEIGGTVKTNGKGGISEVTGDSIIYDIKAEQGYQVGYVRLNGKTLNGSDYADGKLTLNKSALETSNMLEVQFVTVESAKSYEAKGITLSYDVAIAGGVIGGQTGDPSGSDPNVLGIVIGVIVAVVVVAAAAGVAIVLLKKKKQTAVAGGASMQAKSTAKKSNAVKSQTTTAKKTTATKSKTAAKPKTSATAVKNPGSQKTTATKPQAAKKPTSTAKTEPKSTTKATPKATGKTSNTTTKKK
ncbi:MAG: hypothetical protein K2N18_02315, partial [Clostridia bacterium]|nr:hypothetical protein [Clostridia bacterium]